MRRLRRLSEDTAESVFHLFDDAAQAKRRSLSLMENQ